jgi:hypothetical protein
MFNFGEVYQLVILYREFLLKKAAIYVVKKVGLESHKEINILVWYLNKSV